MRVPQEFYDGIESADVYGRNNSLFALPTVGLARRTRASAQSRAVSGGFVVKDLQCRGRSGNLVRGTVEQSKDPRTVSSARWKNHGGCHRRTAQGLFDLGSLLPSGSPLFFLCFTSMLIF